MTTDEIEDTRRCARAHSGSHRLDALTSRGHHFMCRGCAQIYSRRQAVEALVREPPVAGPGVCEATS